MSLEETMARDRRLCILRLLSEDPDYALNESILQKGLYPLSHGVSRDQIRTDLAWLQEQGLLRVEETHGLQVARLSERGNDVAHGRAIVPGVDRPSPK